MALHFDVIRNWAWLRLLWVRRLTTKGKGLTALPGGMVNMVHCADFMTFLASLLENMCPVRSAWQSTAVIPELRQQRQEGSGGLSPRPD